MKTNILKYSLLTAIALTAFTSCIGEDDYATPDYKDKVTISLDSPFVEDFEDYTAGGGSNEVAIKSGGWVNLNAGTGNRLWHVRQFSNNQYADFSSFYSQLSHTDDAWLVTPKLELLDGSYSLSFDTRVRFFTNDNLSVFISTDFNGTVGGLATANWEPLDAFIAGVNEDGSSYRSSGIINLDEYKNSVIRIGFRYVGNRSAGETSSYELDNVTIFENENED